MVITLRHDLNHSRSKQFMTELEARGISAHVLVSESGTGCRLRLAGGFTDANSAWLASCPDVSLIQHSTAPYSLVSRSFQQRCSVVDVGGIRIGGNSDFVIMAGPCSVESEKQIRAIAGMVKKAGAHILRGGAFKPRTSP